MKSDIELAPYSEQELLVGFEKWCGAAYRRLRKLIEFNNEHFGALGYFGHYRAANVLGEAWELANFTGAEELAELCKPRQAVQPYDALECMIICLTWCEEKTSPGPTSSPLLEETYMRAVMERMDRFAKKFKAADQIVSVVDMTTTDHDRDRLVTILRTALKAGEGPNQESLQTKDSRPGDPRQNADAKLPERFEDAYEGYKLAAATLGGNPTDKQAYEWVQDAVKAKGYSEEQLPDFETWQRYLRGARRHYGEQKNSPRYGRTGRSIVSQADIESESEED